MRGMKEAAQNLGISLPDLDVYLGNAIPEFSGLTSVTKFGTGQSNPTYQLTAESGTYVLRSKPPGRLLPSAHAVEREFRVMQALADTDVPVPAVLHLAEAEVSPSRRAFFVMRYLPGRIFWDPALPDCDAGERWAIYDAMNAALAALHDIDPVAVGLGDFGKPGNYFARQLDRWSKQYLASTDAPLEAMTDIMAWLGAHMPPDDGQVALVHGDYRLDNMIFAPDAPHIAGVLDWELSTLGHPIADLAYQRMQGRLPPGEVGRALMGVDRKALGIPSEDEYVEMYMKRAGLTSIPELPFATAFSFFRICAILQGVKKRGMDGNASNPEAAMRMGDKIPGMAQLALQCIAQET